MSCSHEGAGLDLNNDCASSYLGPTRPALLVLDFPADQACAGGVWVGCITPDGQRAITGSEDAGVRGWSLDKGDCVHTWRGHTGVVMALCVTSDGSAALSASHDGTAR